MAKYEINVGVEQWASKPVRPGANSKVSEEEHGLFQRFLGKSTEPFGLNIRDLLRNESISGMEQSCRRTSSSLSYEEIFAEGMRAMKAMIALEEKPQV
ncbi:MAG: hypothetical protein WCV81_04475 [Microgenomates group bacterium]|jgi:hypothetical protein